MDLASLQLLSIAMITMRAPMILARMEFALTRQLLASLLILAPPELVAQRQAVSLLL
jgi:hypothetical protein